MNDNVGTSAVDRCIRLFGLCGHYLFDLIFGERRRGELSARVCQRIERQQASSEIVVSWIQAAAIGFFAIVYTISPKSFSSDVAFQPVPWALGFYALFTLVRIVLAHRRKIGRGLVTISIIVDFAVLMITIWSFHLQYQAPASLSLKAPTMMYVFILIALRMLRFEPGFVVLAGCCAALGWLALFVVAIGLPPDTTLITRSYIEYMTSFKILVGAEVDKVLSIMTVTAVLALALHRARRLLTNAIEDEVAAADLSRFFAPEVAELIRRTKNELGAGLCEQRSTAILAIDLRGFTQVSQQIGPQEILKLLSDYQSRLVPVVHKHGGSIDKYLGDGILVSFGAVAPGPTYAADLFRAMEELGDVARSWQKERADQCLPAPSVGMAADVGEVVFGTVGHGNRLEYTVIGDVVNTAAKLEKHTKREKVRILATRRAYELALEQGYRPGRQMEHRSARPVDGLADPVDLIVLAD
jgi:adenylate cyclase